jgi:hypothetical protein
MSKHTLSLKQKSAKEPAETTPEPVIAKPSDITAEQVLEWLKKNGVPTSPPEPGSVVLTTIPAPAAADFDWKYDAPIERNPFDFSKLNPHAKVVPVSLPAKMWGNPRLLTSP